MAFMEVLMKHICEFISGHRYIALSLLLIPILVWFQYLEMTIRPLYIMYSPLDDRIPFFKEFVVFYVLWFLFVPFGVIYTAVFSKKDFLKLLLFLFGGMAVSCAAYMIFPNAQDLRPAVPGNDPFSALVRIIYSRDTPTNVCPSMHVTNCVAVDAALRHNERFARKRSRSILSFVFTVLVCLSTMLIKQHSVLDVLGGLAVSACFYVPLYVKFQRKEHAAKGLSAFDKRHGRE